MIAAVRDHLANGQSVVLQLVTTAESILDRRLDALSPDERAELEIDLSPREYVIDYLERAFPTRQMRVLTDDTGTQRSTPMEDDAGNPVYNPEAQAARAQLIEQLCALPPITSALDGLLEQFGHDNVAEVSVPPSARVQLLAFQSPRVGALIAQYALPRYKAGGIHRKIAERRSAFLRHGAWVSMSKDGPFHVRNHRIFLSVSIRSGKATPEELTGVRDSIVSTLQSIDMPATRLKPVDLIRANLILRRGETLYPRRHARNLIIGVYGNLFRILADDMAQLVSLKEPSLLGTLKSYLTRREQEDREKQKKKDD